MSSALNDEIEKDVLPWLRLAEDLRVLKLDVDLNIPQICVMGDQSSGKSSVLEALSGIPFPRGSGLVTRCPIRMVMKRARDDESWVAVVSTTLSQEKIVVKDIPELSRVMDRLTEELCAGSNSFSTENIVVELTSPDACDLTVVDLPGIIRTVTAGQNTTSIEQVNRLIKTFLMDKRTIILAVIPANQDIATIDILEKASMVDPSGERTIGVLTKTDLIGPGNEDEVLAVVNNIRKPLALGYIMVKNRSQKDLSEKMSNLKAREMEIAFFSNHPVFRTCNPKLYGVAQLSKRLTQLLVNRIQLELAPMKIEVEKQINEVRAAVRQLPSSYITPKTTADRQKLLVSIIQQYVRHLTECIRGDYRDRIMVRNSELRLYTEVLQKFEEFQFAINEKAPKFKDEEFVALLATQIEQLRGRELPGFMSSQAFYMCMSQYIDDWFNPMQQLILDIRKTTLEVTGKLTDILFVQYPKLRDAFHSVIEKVLTDTSDDVVNKLNGILDREKDPFTLNDFLQQWVNKIRFDKFSTAVDTCFDNAKTPAKNWNGLKDEIFVGLKQWYRTTHAISPLASAQDMCAIMEAYWNLSAKRFIDNCCMIADRDILSKLPSDVQDNLYPFIRDDAILESFFTENPELQFKKSELETRRDRLMQASSKLSSVLSASANATQVSKTFSVSSTTTTTNNNNNDDVQKDENNDFSALTTTTTNSKNLNDNNSSINGIINNNNNNNNNNGSISSYFSLSNSKQQQQTKTYVFSVIFDNKGLGLKFSNVETNGSNAVIVLELKDLNNGDKNPCQLAGMKIGDRLLKINEKVINNAQEAIEEIKISKGSNVKFSISRLN